MRNPLGGAALQLLLACALAGDAFARAGGGHNGGKGSLLGYLIAGPFVLIYAWYVNRRINRKKKETEEAMRRMAVKDAAWGERELEAFVRADFFRVQNAWCAKDFATLAERLDAPLFTLWKVQLDFLAYSRHSNRMDDLSLDQVRFVDAKDYPGGDRDEFTVCLDAAAIDYTVDDVDGRIVDTNTGDRRAKANLSKKREKFREFWTYTRKGQTWALARIEQSDHWRSAVDEPIVEEG